ncbi:hypothetical protein TBK1r_33690 [Stieleria magnilauensis]|uniref:3-keto-alpha-glucoside-1,2-lyase/3-keto-2-hydroxy-glucal hydratase domain-containing protein n=2 Tax=Stieleria magnilauensis TaxID=2527963 RepID=A0ABX5XRA2_9BACT|nr:hypothetical protein TBK1r_33690 [Planctomycetes bacterium TBK1r]
MKFGYYIDLPVLYPLDINPTMKLTRLVFAAAIAAFVTMPPVTQAESPDAFQPLFNGENLEGWHGRPHFSPIKLAEMSEEERSAKLAEWQADAEKHWRVENGELVNDGHGAYLVTNQDYRDYELYLEYKTVPLADSGIYLKGTPQVQIWDSTETAKFKLGADKGSGGLWNNSAGAPGKDPLVHADKPFGQWNSVRVLQIGARTTVWLNDQMVVDHAIMENFWDRQSPLFVSGPIELQTHGGEIRWRNLKIRELSTQEANNTLAAKNANQFESIFNGSDLTGWVGATDNYEVVDGAIGCKKGKGGNLLTENEYANFVARLEFRLPPGGNNGLAIRAPLEGNPAYQAMCELQVLDNTHPKYAKLDERQYHGSAYGMAAATRGFLRPVGEWNFQEVTVDGSTITVELNGTVILKTDLSQITDYMADSAHPGKDRKKGHFGFAGHGDAVQFRGLSIREL